MFGWFKRDAAGYTSEERDIFPFWDGSRRRKGDPLTIQRLLLTDQAFDAKHDPGIAQVPTIDGLRAAGRVADAVRRAFQVKTVEEGGLTDGECLNLFCQFGTYMAELTEDGRPLASSPQPTEVAASGDSVTGSGADSGSIVAEQAEPVQAH